MRSATLLSLTLALGCAEARPPSYEVSIARERLLPIVDLPAHLEGVGIAIDPDTGVVEIAYASGWELALVRLRRDLPFAAGIAWRGSAGARTDDVVALGGGRYAIVAPDAGYLFDAALGASQEFFCYFPGREEGEWPPELEQRSRALAYDPIAHRLYAQPRTTSAGELVRNEIAAFDPDTGDDVAWWTIDPDLEAEAMAALPDGRLALASATALHAFDPATGLTAELSTLDELGLGRIAALAWDREDEVLLALEVGQRRLTALEVRASE